MKVDIPQEAYNTIIDYCSRGCDFCVFADPGYYTGTECKIKKPEYWEIEDEEDS